MKLHEVKRDGKEVHYNSGASYSIKIKSDVLPFVIDNMDYRKMEIANDLLQKFVTLLEKKFDVIWYMGSDFEGEKLYERFMFHHGGFMEISLSGELRCYFYEDKVEKFKKALFYAVKKMSNKASAIHLVKQAHVGKKLISLENSIKL